MRPDLVTVPVHRSVPRLATDPLGTLERIGRQAGGELVRLHLGLARPYLVTHPDQVQHVLRNPDVYRREGMMWRPLRRLVGDGIAADGPAWQRSRRVLQPLLAVRHVNALLDGMAQAVAEGLDRLAAATAGGRPVDLTGELTRVTQRVMIRVFFGDRIPDADADRLGEAIDTAFQSMSWRLLLPFVADRVPLPGDRRFGRAVAVVDQLVHPLVRAGRTGTGSASGAGAPDDLVARFARAIGPDGRPLSDRQVRDDLVAMFVAGTDTVALALTWLFLLLERHPQVAAELADEAAEVVADGAPGPEHLPGLVRTRMALQEALRLYPITWIIPRTVARTDELAGTVLRPGTTVVLSPYLTHRLPQFWPDPEQFRPDRFAPDRAGGRHRFAYLPFSAGVHQCLGEHFSLREGQLVMAGLLRRFRPRLAGTRSLRPRARIDLRPEGAPQLLLSPRG